MARPNITADFNRCPSCHRLFKRSPQANRLYWALLHMIASQVAGGKFGVESWHTYFKSRFLGCEEVKLPNGKYFLIPNSTASLDVGEFNDYYTKVEAWAAEHAVYLDYMEIA
jgi:hypothetical protein